MKKTFTKMILIMLVVAMAGCSKKAGIPDGVDYQPDYTSNHSGYYYLASDSAAKNDGRENNYEAMPDEAAKYDQIKKVIVTTEMKLETYEMDETLSMILSEVTGSHGYVQSSSEGKRSYGENSFRRYATLVLRIPAGNYDAFMEAIRPSGNVISLSSETDDITEAYYDLQAQIESLKLEEERVKSFYEVAENIDELLRIEQRLTEIQSQIAQKESTMKNYQLLTDYCTVTISIQEVTTYTETSDTFFSRLLRELKGSAEGFVRFLENTLFFLINAFWYIVLAAVVWVVFRKIEARTGFIRNIREKRAERKQRKLEAKRVKDTL